MQANRGGYFLHLACQGGGAHPCPRQLRHCLWLWRRNFGKTPAIYSLV